MKTFSKKSVYLAGKTDATNSSLWLPLWMHLRDTSEIMALLVKLWLPDSVKRAVCMDEDKLIAVARFLGGVHDVGKATVSFQSRILKAIPDARLRVEKNTTLNFTQRDLKKTTHAIASEAILLDVECPVGIASIAGSHHGKTQESCNVETQLEVYYNNYYSNGEKEFWTDCWNEIVESALCCSGYERSSELPDSLTQPEEVLLTGLLTMADWIASNQNFFPLIPIEEMGCEELYPERVDYAWEQLGLSMPWEAQSDIVRESDFEFKFKFLPNSVQKSMIHTANSMNSPGIMILEAQMGGGKTEAALAATEILASHFGAGGIFFGLPTQATANGIFPRLINWANAQPDEICHSIRLAHGMANLNEDYIQLQTQSVSGYDAEEQENQLAINQWFRGNKQALLADFVIGTVDQLLMAALRQKHVMLRILGLVGKVVIIDECHAYDAYMNQYLDCILKWLGWYKVPVILLSATLPAKRRIELVEAYLGHKGEETDLTWKTRQGYPLLTWTDELEVKQKMILADTPLKHVRIQSITEREITELLSDRLKDGGCAGIIVNTVRKAQELAESLKMNMPDKDVVVFHAQFLMPDRTLREKALIERVGKNSSPSTRNNLILIGTQVLEQSLDIDFDFMITELCPMDLMLQRIGRLHRHTRNRPDPLREMCCAILDTGNESFDSGSKAVYGEWLLWRTRKLIPSMINMPDDIPKLVQQVYEWKMDDSLVEDSSAQPMRNAYEREQEKRRQKAKAYLIKDPEVHELFPQLNSLDDWMAEAMTSSDDAAARAAVRDGDSSIDVLVMMRKNDGRVHFLPWQEHGRAVDTDSPPQPEIALQIAKQRLQLPRIFSKPWNMEKTIKELENENRNYLSQWQLSSMLRGELILLLDEYMSARLAGMTLYYDKDKGLVCRKEEKNEGN